MIKNPKQRAPLHQPNDCGKTGRGARQPLAPARAARRRYRYRRRHTPHYYIVLTGLSAAAIVCLLNVAAYDTRSMVLSELAFVAVLVTALIISTAFFWGFYLAMQGYFPTRRIKYVIPHGAVGVLSPLLYTLNISIDLEDVGRLPISGLSLACSVACFFLLCLQFAMGKAVVRPEPLRLVPKVND